MTKLFRTVGLTAIVVAAIVLLVPVSAWADPATVRMKDDCDPVTFAFVPGGCTGDGGTTFSEFTDQLADHHFAGAWRFSPDRVKIDAGSSVQIVNRGGEVHTFSPVSQFGGGIVPPLNQLVFGNPFPPTFFLPNPPGAPTNFVAQGRTIAISGLSPGTHLFECAIHPWMHATVVVGNND